MGEGEAVHGRVVLVGTAHERHVGVDVRREVDHLGLPRLVPVGVGAAGELHVQEHPVLEDDAEGLGTPIEIPRLLSHIDGSSGPLDGTSALVEHRVQRLDEYGDVALVVEVGQLLDAERVFVLNPRFQGRTAIVVPSVGRIHVTILERHYDARNGATVDAEVGHVNLQHVCSLIVGVRGVVRELGVENDVVLRLVVLELDGARSEVISGRIEHSLISRGYQARRPRWVLRNSRRDGQSRWMRHPKKSCAAR